MHWYTSTRFVAAWVFLGLLVVYQINGDYYPMLDATPSAMIAESILNEGNLSISPEEIPENIVWTLHGPHGSRQVEITYVDEQVAELYADGTLTAGMEYCVGGRCVPTIYDGLYASTFSPGAGLTALPLFAALRPFTGPVSAGPVLIWYASKLVASLCVAGSAALLFLTAARFVSLAPALIVALSYGLGTCVWSTGSQALWQHGPNELYLALGTYFLVRTGEGARWGALCGLAFAAATWCRPTGGLVVVAVGVYLLLTDRRTLLAFILAGLPLAIALVSYSTYYFGSPLEFGQLKMQQVAIDKTGSSEIWQTPVWYGLIALLLSPSRGLLIYSPFLVFAMVGVVAAWRDRRFVALRPLSVAILAIWVLEARHFDWWGGWSFGYRHIVDTVPLLCAFLIPVGEMIVGRWRWRAIYVPLVAWSIFVQVLGAFAYNLGGWNARPALWVHGPAVERPIVTFDFDEARRWQGKPGVRLDMIGANVDLPRFRHRLWSIRDSQIVYYATHWSEARRNKHEFAAELSKDFTTRRAESHLALGDAWLELGQFDRALENFRLARETMPRSEAAAIGEGLALALAGRWDEAIEVYQGSIRDGVATHEAYNHLGVILWLLGDVSSAISAFDQAAADDLPRGREGTLQVIERWKLLQPPTGPAADSVGRATFDRARSIMEHFWQGAALAQQGRSDEARSAYETALQREANLPAAWNRLGVLALQEDDIELAEQHLRRSLELDAANAEAHELLGIVLVRQRQPEQAREHFQAALDAGIAPARIERYLRTIERLHRRAEVEGGSASRPSSTDEPATTKTAAPDRSAP